MIYILGGAGVKNFGDEIMLKNWLNFYRDAKPRDNIVVDGANVQFLNDFFSDYEDDVEFCGDVSQLKWAGPESFWESLRRGLMFYEKGGFKNYPEYKRRAQQIEKIRLMHLHGGGYINTLWPKNAFLLGLAAATKKRYGCKLVATGIGLLPLPHVPQEYKADFEQVIAAFDFLETRDRESADSLRAEVGACPNVFAGLDDTYLEPISTVEAPRALHFSYFSSRTTELEALLGKLPKDTESRFDKTYFWLCTDSDRKCLDITRKYLPKCESLSLYNLVFKPLPLGPKDFMITARFHPHFYGARAGASGLFSAGDGYYDVKHGSICQLGSGFRPYSPKDAKIEIPEEDGRALNPMVDFDAQRVAMKRGLAKRIIDLLQR